MSLKTLELLVTDAQVSSWPSGASCGNSQALRHTASRHPPRTGPACSTCWCGAARCKPRRRACSGRAWRRGGWPPSGASPPCCRCRPAAAPPRSWRGCEPGSGGCSPCLSGRTRSASRAVQQRERQEWAARMCTFVGKHSPVSVGFWDWVSEILLAEEIRKDC